MHELRSNYRIDKSNKILGSGFNGKVFLSENLHNPSLKVAIKVIDKTKMLFDLPNIMEEVQILSKLDHPNIVKYFETYNDKRYFYLIQEYVEGKQLFEYITSMPQARFTEQTACLYFKQIVEAILHCHTNNVIHRDIKPENIIVKSNNSKVKLLDFGLNKSAGDVMKHAGCTGSPFYMAPEVIKGSNYDFMCDMWSLGVLLYIFLSGFMPFPARKKEDLF